MLLRAMAFALLVLVSLCASTGAYTWADWTALDEYVQSDDGYYSWTEIGRHDYEGVTLYLLNMTSQKWQDETFSTRPIWFHYASVAIPNDIRHPDHGFIFVGGGSNDDDEFPLAKEHYANLVMARLANDTGTCGGYVFQIPNEPTYFYNDPTWEKRSEDEIIAWSWRTYLDNPNADPSVILRMPMTKAAKRGLDMVHEVVKEKIPSSHIDQFLVFGASKRGWTAWSLACTDQRVVALVPIVFSLINIPATMLNHFEDMNGAWSFAFEPYYHENLTAELYTPRMDDVLDVEDIYRYKDRLAGIPKLLISATGDEFFLLDDTHQWWNDMPEPKWYMIVPNAEHTLAPQYLKVYESIAGFFMSFLEQYPMPQVTWTMGETVYGGYTVVNTIPLPYNITAWSATTLTTDDRRDFRLAHINETSGEPDVHGVRWEEDLTVIDSGTGSQYTVSAEKVAGEWVGFFIQTIYLGPPPQEYHMYLTTQVNVIPFARPRGPCLTNEECYAYLT